MMPNKCAQKRKTSANWQIQGIFFVFQTLKIHILECRIQGEKMAPTGLKLPVS
jgi:hypothetical protein